MTMAAVLILGLAGCGRTQDNQSTADDAGEQKDETDIMIVYFSRSGNTQLIAEMIQEQTQGELFQIETAVPYADDYDTVHGGGAGSSFSTVGNAVQGAEVLEGFSVSGAGASGTERDVADWLRRLNIIS